MPRIDVIKRVPVGQMLGAQWSPTLHRRHEESTISGIAVLEAEAGARQDRGCYNRADWCRRGSD